MPARRRFRVIPGGRADAGDRHAIRLIALPLDDGAGDEPDPPDRFIRSPLARTAAMSAALHAALLVLVLFAWSPPVSESAPISVTMVSAPSPAPVTATTPEADISPPPSSNETQPDAAVPPPDMTPAEILPAPPNAIEPSTAHPREVADNGAQPPPQQAALPLIPPRLVSGSAGNSKPDYPADAKRRGIQGKVVLQVEVSREGMPTKVHVLTSSGHRDLDEAAVTSVEKWRFIPASRGGEAVAATAEIPIQFRLAD